MNSQFCPFCGVPLVPGARFCGGCGRPLPEEAPPAPPVVSPFVNVAPPPSIGDASGGAYAGARPGPLVLAAAALGALAVVWLLLGYQYLKTASDYQAAFGKSTDSALLDWGTVVLGLVAGGVAYALWLVRRPSWFAGCLVAILSIGWGALAVIAGNEIGLNGVAIALAGAGLYLLANEQVRTLFGGMAAFRR